MIKPSPEASIGNGRPHRRRSYPTYNPSGVEWLGDVPEGWDVNKIKYSTYVKGRIGWQGLRSDEFIDEGPYLVTGTDFIKGKVNWDTCYHVSEDRYNEDPYIQLRNFDLLITKDGSIGKTAIVAKLPGKSTLNSGIFLTRCTDGSYTTDYMYYLLNSDVFMSFIDFKKSGTTISHLYQNVFVDFSYPSPSLPEQSAIAAFLDRESARIDTLIAKKERQIELLQEKRAALISHTVTKGLDPTVLRRDSGVEWLGEVPEGWKVQKLKHISSVRLSSVNKKTEEGEQPVRLCNYVDVYYNDYITPDIAFMEATASPNEIKNFTLRKGDVLITKDSEEWDDIAVPAYVRSDLPGVLCGYHLAHIRPNEKIINGEYLFRSFHAHGINDQFRVAANGITRYGIGKFWIDSSLFLVPSLPEQTAIAAFLVRETAKIDSLIQLINESMEKIREYRSALISAAVTGKIDVRQEAKA